MPIDILHQLDGKVIVGLGSLKYLEPIIDKLNPYKIGIITDRNVAAIYRDKLAQIIGDMEIDTYIVVNNGEKVKSISTATKIWKILIKKEFTRESLLISFGGGVVGDLAGFVASTYMRGIHFINIPTTLLAQADSAIGGKTGIDMDGKNLIGTFYIPDATIIDPIFVKTLSLKQIANGISEIIKHGIIASNNLLKTLENNQEEIFSKNLTLLEKIIKSSIKIKLDIISRDIREKGIRRILNLGHTIGHAIEKATEYQISHGEAVSIGIANASRISEILLGFDETDRVLNILEQFCLPTKMLVKPDRLVDIMKLDKKNWRGKITMVLTKKIEEPTITEFTEEEIRNVLGDIYE